jgi:hypothetical protein
MKKFVNILRDIIDEQITGAFPFAVDPVTKKELATDYSIDFTTATPTRSQPTNIENEPLPDINSLTDNAKNCLTNVLSQPQFKLKWSNIWGYSNRNIAGTDTKSEHASGNALDFVGAKGNLDPIMQTLADYLVANATELKVKNVIYNYKIWNSPEGWHTYDTSGGKSPHTDHVHVDFIK